jgi:hypothetical protein
MIREHASQKGQEMPKKRSPMKMAGDGLWWVLGTIIILLAAFCIQLSGTPKNLPTLAGNPRYTIRIT